MVRTRPNVRVSQQRMMWLRRSTIVGAIVVGGLMWAYSVAHVVGFDLSGGTLDMTRLAALIQGA